MPAREATAELLLVRPRGRGGAATRARAREAATDRLVARAGEAVAERLLACAREATAELLEVVRRPQALAALVEGGPASRPEEGDQGRRNSQGQKGHFPCFSLLESPEMNILFGPVSTSKFVRNQSVHQQIVKFCMPASKEGSLGMSGSKISLFFNIRILRREQTMEILFPRFWL